MSGCSKKAVNGDISSDDSSTVTSGDESSEVVTSDEASSKNSSSVSSSSSEAPSKDTSSNNSSSDATSSKTTSSNDNSSVNTSSKATSSKATSSRATSSKATSSKATSSKATSSKATSSKATSSNDTSSMVTSSVVVSSEPVSSEYVPKTQSAMLSIEDDIFARVNELRASIGLPAYTKNNMLKGSAYIRSKEMYDYSYFEHTRPNGTDFQTAIEEVGYNYTYAMENIGELNGYSSSQYAETLFTAWKNSPPHYDAMISAKCDEIGIAIYEGNGKVYATQHFGKK